MTADEALDLITLRLSRQDWSGADDLIYIDNVLRQSGRHVAETGEGCVGHGGECDGDVVALISGLALDPADAGGKVGEPVCELHRQHAEHYGYDTKFLDE